MLHIAHVVNPVNVDERSDLYVAQPITFESMRRAAHFTKSSLHVDLYAVSYPEDEAAVPKDFTRIINLSRSVLDTGSFRVRRRLPLIRDILCAAKEAADAEYLIYTNVDIALQPYFYSTISSYIRRGHDAIVVNRRTITPRSLRIEDLDLMYPEMGDAHPGFDCFVFPRTMVERMELSDVCIGAPGIGLNLVLNLVKLSRRLRFIEDAHLTFHIGDDQYWNGSQFNEYELHNHRELIKCVARLESRHGPFTKTECPSWSHDALNDIRKTVTGIPNGTLLQKLRRRLEHLLKGGLTDRK